MTDPSEQVAAVAEAICGADDYYWSLLTPDEREPYYRRAAAAIDALQLTEAAQALCTADSILSLLHYRHRNELSEQNRADVEAAASKLASLRRWYGPWVEGER